MPRPMSASAWVVIPIVVRPRRVRRRLDGRHVDMRGQVLSPDVDERVVVDTMAEVGPERPVPSPARVVQLDWPARRSR